MTGKKPMSYETFCDALSHIQLAANLTCGVLRVAALTSLALTEVKGGATHEVALADATQRLSRILNGEDWQKVMKPTK